MIAVKEIRSMPNLLAEERQAFNITQEQFVADEYHASIIDAAHLLVTLDAGRLFFATQWANGASLWVDDLRDPNVSATVDGDAVQYAGRL
jgi:hypothetical protein